MNTLSGVRHAIFRVLRPWIPVFAGLTVLGCSPQPVIAPGGIVSNNPCIDAILAEVAAPGQIAAVSKWSHSAASGSAPLAWAQAIPAIGASAEESIAARPDRLLTGNLPGMPATDVALRAGIKVLSVSVPTSLKESLDQIGQISTFIGRGKAGQQLIHRINSLTQPVDLVDKSAIIWLSGGFVPGKGTLQDELISRAGYRNASATYQLGQWGQLPLERLVSYPPDVIFAAKSHPIFKRLPHTRIVYFPERLTFCGGPSIIAAMKVLRS